MYHPRFQFITVDFFFLSVKGFISGEPVFMHDSMLSYMSLVSPPGNPSGTKSAIATWGVGNSSSILEI